MCVCVLSCPVACCGIRNKKRVQHFKFRQSQNSSSSSNGGGGGSSTWTAHACVAPVYTHLMPKSKPVSYRVCALRSFFGCFFYWQFMQIQNGSWIECVPVPSHYILSPRTCVRKHHWTESREMLSEHFDTRTYVTTCKCHSAEWMSIQQQQRQQQ